MAEKVKKTIPWFLVLALIGLMVGVGLSVGKPAAQAEDLGTSVVVGNAAPTLSGEAESPASYADSPTDVGNDVTFTATGDDPNGEDYYLAICKTNNITDVEGDAPTCDDGAWCISTATTDNTEATCSTTTESEWSQSNVWYAFVCDGNASDAKCSGTSGNQGSGDSGSPFKVNHRPTFTSVTDDDAGNPGASDFTVEADTYDDTDDDTTQDKVKLYVCTTNSWSTTSGCGVSEWCASDWVTPTATLSCDLTIPSPAAHGTNNQDYYAFIMDDHNFAASGGVHGSVGHYSVNDVAPTIEGSVTLHDGNNITIPIKPGTVGVTTTATLVTDNNGYSDIESVTSTIYISYYTSGCTADNNNCYKISSSNCESSDCSGASCTYTCTTTMSHYTDPTDASTGNPWASYYWNSEVTVKDESNYGSASYTGSAVETETQTALDITESEIDYGSISASNDTGSDNSTTTVVNYGNSPLDVKIYGTAMLLGGSDWDNIIATSSQEFATSSFAFGDGVDLIEEASASANGVGALCAKPTSDTGVEDEVSWGMEVPGGTTAGSYSGTNSFIAVLESDEWPGL